VQLEEEELAEEGLGGGEEEELSDVMLQLQQDFVLHFSCGEYIYIYNLSHIFGKWVDQLHIVILL
jgi:hypothetical protein